MRKTHLPTRRGILAGAALAVALPAPAILAQAPSIRIGILNTFSGPLGYAGDDTLRGIDLYFSRAEGRLAGRKVELIKADDEAKPQPGLKEMKRLVEVEKVDLVIGPQVSGVAFALLDYVKASKTFLIISGAGADRITWQRIPTMFRTSVTSWQLTYPIAYWMLDRFGGEIVMIGNDFAPIRDGFRRMMPVFGVNLPHVDRKALKEIYVPLDTGDFGAYLADIRALNPDVVYAWFGGTDAVRFVQQYRELGLRSALVGFSTVFDATTFPAQGKAALGNFTTAIYTEALENPANQRFLAGYRERYGDYPNLYAEYGFTAAQALDEAVKGASGAVADKTRLAEAMAHIRFEAPRGPFKFDADAHHPVETVYICEVQEIDGRLVNKNILGIEDVKDPGKAAAFQPKTGCRIVRQPTPFRAGSMKC